MMTTINYKTRKPVVYNAGTEWEKSNDTFLAYYTFKTIEEAQKEVDELNSTHPTHLPNRQPIDWEKIEYFFVDEQEMFDTRDSF